MPWTEESPIAAGFGAAAGLIGGFQQGQQQKAEQQRQAQIDQEHQRAISVATANAQRKQQDDDEKAAREDRDLGVNLTPPGLTEPNFSPKPVKGAKPQTPTQIQAYALLARANWYDENHAPKAADQDRKNAAALLAADKANAQTAEIGAQTGLTGAKTVTEGARPGLIKAETKNVGTLHGDRMASLQEQFQRAQLATQAALQRSQMAEAAAASRQAASIAAAMSRMNDHEDFEERQQQRGFEHSDQRQERSFKHADSRAAKHTTPVDDIKPKIANLPAGVQTVILKLLKQGVSRQGVGDAIDKSDELPDDVKAQAKTALGIAPPPKPAAAQGGNWWSHLIGQQ